MSLEVIGKLIKQGLESSKQHEKDSIRKGLQRFKMDVMKYIPFYGDILMKVPVIEDESIPTAQTDGREIRYNPRFFATLNEGQRNFVLMHEVLHMLLFHWKRVEGRDPLIWNIACDYVVNSLLDRVKWKLNSVHKVPFERPHSGCFLQVSYYGTPVEEFYSKLIKENNGSKGKLKYEGKLIGMSPKDLMEALTRAEAEGGDGKNEDNTKTRDLYDQELVEENLRRLIRETIKRRGTGDSYYIPDNMLRLVQSKKLPWHKLLYEFLSERVEEESSYLTPERKYIHMDLIIPGIAKSDSRLGEIWAFVDSSGSIGGNELAQFMTQLYRISKEFQCVFNIAFWDTSVTDVYRNVKNKEKVLECKPRHSGGTDINCVYAYLSENKIKPGVMLILTDGYFGKLTHPVGRLRSRTILVLSEKCALIDNKNEIGRLARL